MAAQTTTTSVPRLSALRPRFSAGWIGFAMLCAIALPCYFSLPWTVDAFDVIHKVEDANPERPPSFGGFMWMGTDGLERNLFVRILLGGAISLGIGLAAAAISVTIGVLYGATSALMGGRVDSTMMRIVDVLYGLPYILLVVLVNIALQPKMVWLFNFVMNEETAQTIAGVVTLLVAIGGVSWLTMARVIRGQVLSLREMPFVEASRAAGARTPHILVTHMLPNLVGPIIVYATLTVPQAILQESFLSFLGIGVRAPLPSWGNLASDGLPELYKLGESGSVSFSWWLIVFPCAMLGITLMALNFMGDALRNHFDPKSRRR